MEKVTRYRLVAKKLFEELGARKLKSMKEVRYQVICDDASGNYILLRNGWRKEHRLYSILVHVEVMADGMVWLHQDDTDLVIADVLLENGISDEDIVLGFHAPAMRTIPESVTG